MAQTNKITVNGVDIEIEGHAEVKVEDGKVRILVGEKKVVEHHYHRTETIRPTPFYYPRYERWPYSEPWITYTSGQMSTTAAGQPSGGLGAYGNSTLGNSIDMDALRAAFAKGSGQ